MTNLKGAEKQVKYAEDILKEIERFLQEAEEAVNEDQSEKMIKRFNRAKTKVDEYFENEKDSAVIITNFKNILRETENHKKANALAAGFNELGLRSEALVTATIPQSFFSFK